MKRPPNMSEEDWSEYQKTLQKYRRALAKKKKREKKPA
jgi:hypothetical protein